MAAITKPDDIYNLASVLGTTNDVAALCTASSIRKWNKCKPVNRNTIDELTAGQRRGAADAPGVPSDRNVNRGWYYGLKIATSQSSDWTDIHEVVTLDYDAPTGGISVSPHRMLDFIGYDHGQGAPCQASFEEGIIHGVSDAENGLIVRIVHSANAASEPSDATGVDTAWCCNASKANVFPVVVVTRNNVSYACALRIEDNKSHPLWYQDRKQEFYHISFVDLPDKSTTDNYTMSIGFCVASGSPQALNVYNNAVPQWQQVTSLGFSQQFFGLANAVGRTLRLQPSDATPDILTATASISVNIAQIASYTLSDYEPSGGPYYVRLWAKIEDSGGVHRGTGYSGTIPIRGAGGIYLKPSVDLTQILEELPYTSTTYTVTLQLGIGTGEGSSFIEKKQSALMTLQWTYNP